MQRRDTLSPRSRAVLVARELERAPSTLVLFDILASTNTSASTRAMALDMIELSGFDYARDCEVAYRLLGTTQRDDRNAHARDTSPRFRPLNFTSQPAS